MNVCMHVCIDEEITNNFFLYVNKKNKRRKIEVLFCRLPILFLLIESKRLLFSWKQTVV